MGQPFESNRGIVPPVHTIPGQNLGAIQHTGQPGHSPAGGVGVYDPCAQFNTGQSGKLHIWAAVKEYLWNTQV